MTKPKITPILPKIPKRATYFIIAALSIILTFIVVFQIAFFNRIYPFVSTGNINLSGLTKEEAALRVNEVLKQRAKALEFEYAPDNASTPQKYSINISSNSFETNSPEVINDAFFIGRSNFQKLPYDAPLNISYNSLFETHIKTIANSIDQPAIDSQLKVDNEEITITPSQEGIVVDQEALKENISYYLNYGVLRTNKIPLKKATPKLSYDDALKIKKRLDQIKLEPLELQFKDQSFTLTLAEIIEFIDLQNTDSNVISYSDEKNNIIIKSITVGEDEVLDTKLSLKKEPVENYFKKIALDIDQPVQEPLFNVDNSSGQTRIKEFQPPVEGRKLDVEQSSEKLYLALITPEQRVVNLPVATTQPKNQLTNDLGIKELIGRGISNFSGSIPNRIYNVGLAASRINGVLVKPGETFSFTNTVGDISAATGYKQAYVIKSGRTVLDDGGGVCQVSTTLFRAVLNSGLPVIKRTAHAYRVSYYEQGYPPGLDATIYHPSVDFQFKNDTAHHVLIQSYVVGTTMYVDFYGTSDGRVAEVSTPVITGQTPPPPELRQDDPTLPKGTVKQVDWAAAGANVVFTRKVTKGGETIINETFRSNYRPWQAVFLVGTM